MPGYDDETLIVIANLYYIEGLSQEEVAAKMGLSRVAVTRMLRRAREEGLVQITVKKPLPELFALGLRLEQVFGLKTALVVPTGPCAEETREAVGRGGAELLAKLAGPGSRIGVAWSATVRAMLPFVRRPDAPPARIHELAGTYLEPGTPYGLSSPLAEKLGVPVESIPMPVLVSGGAVKAMMLKEPAIGKALEHAAKVDLAFVGLGGVSRDASIFKTGYIGAEQLEEFRSKGAVGDVLMRYYDAEGRYLPMSFEDRTVSLDWESVRRLPRVVAMAFGPEKLEAIRGAIRGGVVNGLVTDRLTAEALLAGADASGGPPAGGAHERRAR